MGYLPIFLDVGGCQCVVIGSGPSAEARIRALLDAGAIVTVVNREAPDGTNLRDGPGRVRHLAREYRYGDLRGSSLVYVAAADVELVECAVGEARELGIPLSVVDDPESSTFISPASLRRGDLQIAISTGGASPSIARMIRQRLEPQFGPQYGLLLKIMRRARQFLRSHEPNQSERSRILQSLSRALLDSVGKLDYALLEQTLRVHLDTGVGELGLDVELQDRTMTVTAGAPGPR
jgi:precorrin-2 dehydrogenase / sirohydrochlorin ferrochelatase